MNIKMKGAFRRPAHWCNKSDIILLDSHLFSIALIFFLAGFTQGVSGFGSALVAMPFLLLFQDAQTAVPLCTLNSLVITCFLSLQLRKHVDLKKILPLIISCIPGIYLGTQFLRKSNSDLIEFLLGILLVSYALYNLVKKPAPRKIKKVWAYVAGFLTGLIGSVFSAGGPPTIIYTTLTGWKKDDIKATLSAFFFITGIFVATAHFLSGLTTITVVKYFGISVWTVLPGVWAGSICYGKIKQETYMKIILYVLIIMGTMMIVTAR